MRVLIIADAHGRVPDWSGIDRSAYDMVLFAGDLTNGNHRPQRLRRFMEKLAPIAPFSYIPGNNDQPVFNEQDFTDLGMTNLHDRWLVPSEAGHPPVVGFGGASTGIINFFAHSEEEMRAKFSELFAGAPPKAKLGFLLVTHDPPRDTSLDETFGGDHVGSAAVREFILDGKPILAACGHIHEARGVEKLGVTWVVNPGPCKQGHAAVAEITTGSSGRLEVAGVELVELH
ncbi:MAG: metallophosphoesterase family protein [Promethearchaeota archaeon]